jgi:hypothetical protein
MIKNLYSGSEGQFKIPYIKSACTATAYRRSTAAGQFKMPEKEHTATAYRKSTAVSSKCMHSYTYRKNTAAGQFKI